MGCSLDRIGQLNTLLSWQWVEFLMYYFSVKLECVAAVGKMNPDIELIKR